VRSEHLLNEYSRGVDIENNVGIAECMSFCELFRAPCFEVVEKTDFNTQCSGTFGSFGSTIIRIPIHQSSGTNSPKHLDTVKNPPGGIRSSFGITAG
jgi:hypothetical protein